MTRSTRHNLVNDHSSSKDQSSRKDHSSSSYPWFKFNLSRRGFLKATGTAAAATAVASVITPNLAGCTNSNDTTQDTSPVMIDTSQADYIINPNTNESNYTSQDFPYTAYYNWTLPLGSVLYPQTGKTWIPYTLAGSSAYPMIKGAALNLTTGQSLELVSEPHTTSQSNTAIYDVRCSDTVYAWVEMDLITRSWSLLAASFAQGTLSSDVRTLWQADANYDPPAMAVVDNRVFWQVMPSTSGNKTTEHSFLYEWTLGETNANARLESPGRFATAPMISGNTITVAPRVNASQGVFYGVSAYSLDDMSTLVDQLVLPASVKPLNAVRIGSEFAVSIEASYSTGGLLGTMGTYLGHKDGTFVALGREPYAAVAGKDNYYFIKSTTSYFAVDTQARTYSVLAAQDRCVDYGEYPASAGSCEFFVTFSTIKDDKTGYPTSVSVRAFKL